MNVHVHPRFNLDGVLKRAGWNRDNISTHHLAPSLRIHRFVRSVTIHIASEIQPRSIKLLERRRHFEGKPENLIGGDLLLQGCARLGSIIDNPHYIPTIKTIRVSMIARVGVMKNGHGNPIDGLGSRDRGHILKKLPLNRLQRSLADLTSIGPPTADRIRKVLLRLGNREGLFRPAHSRPGR